MLRGGNTETYFFCKFLQNSGELIQQNIQYDDIFGDTVSKQTKVMRIMFIKIQRRNKIINERKKI